MLPTVLPHGLIPPITLKPPILHNLHPPPALALERLKHVDIVCVAHADELDLPRVLQRNERLPRRDGALERLERGVQDVAIDVRRTQVLERVCEGVLDLRFET